MTPKEKAEELVKKYGKTLKKDLKGGGYKYNVLHAKQCALICVDEILSWNPTLFWETVKTEIEKL
jgi:hypothetical protein